VGCLPAAVDAAKEAIKLLKRLAGEQPAIFTEPLLAAYATAAEVLVGCQN
jgi:hypothetical protein